MDRVIDLTAVVQQEVADYAHVQDWKAKSYYLEDIQNNLFTVIWLPDDDHPDAPKPDFLLLVRVIDEKVFIQQDINDRPLYKELMRSGIPREQIILAYAGEKLPDDNSS